MIAFRYLALVCLTTALLVGTVANAQDSSASSRNIFVPSTISPEAQQVLRAIIEAKPYARIAPQTGDLKTWRQLHAATEVAVKEFNKKAVERTGVIVTDATLGGVPVLDIRPPGLEEQR